MQDKNSYDMLQREHNYKWK